MAKFKKKLKPIGGSNGVLKSRRIAREITGKYHVIQNEIEQIDKRKLNKKSLPNDENRRIELVAEMEKNGGVDFYQKASIISTEHFKTSRWVIRSLQEEPLNRKPINKGEKLYVLEVGAINIQLQQCPWLKVRAIDLNSQHKLIETQDMLTLPESTFFQFDAIVSSMVINCVCCPYKRYVMLLRLCLHMKENSVLFIILPTRCIESKLMGAQHFTNILHAMGLKDAVARRKTPKLTFFTLVKSKALGKNSVPPSCHTVNGVSNDHIRSSNENDTLNPITDTDKQLVHSNSNPSILDKFLLEVNKNLNPSTKKFLSNNPKIWEANPTVFCMSITPPSL